MTVKLNTFYEKLESQNAKRHKIYKKLVRIAEKKFPAIQESVGKAYIEDNKTALHTLNLLKNNMEIGGGAKNTYDEYTSELVNSHATNYNNLVNNVVSELESESGGGVLSKIKNLAKNTASKIGIIKPAFYTFLKSDTYKIKEIDDILDKNNFKTDKDIFEYFEKTSDIKQVIIDYVNTVKDIYNNTQNSSSPENLDPKKSNELEKKLYTLAAYASAIKATVYAAATNKSVGIGKGGGNDEDEEEVEKTNNNNTDTIDESIDVGFLIESEKETTEYTILDYVEIITDKAAVDNKYNITMPLEITEITDIYNLNRYAEIILQELGVDIIVINQTIEGDENITKEEIVKFNKITTTNNLKNIDKDIFDYIQEILTEKLNEIDFADVVKRNTRKLEILETYIIPFITLRIYDKFLKLFAEKDNSQQDDIIKSILKYYNTIVYYIFDNNTYSNTYSNIGSNRIDRFIILYALLKIKVDNRYKKINGFESNGNYFITIYNKLQYLLIKICTIVLLIKKI